MERYRERVTGEGDGPPVSLNLVHLSRLPLSKPGSRQSQSLYSGLSISPVLDERFDGYQKENGKCE